MTNLSLVISAFLATSVVVRAFMIAPATSFLTSAVRHAFGSHVIMMDGILEKRFFCRAWVFLDLLQSLDMHDLKYK